MNRFEELRNASDGQLEIVGIHDATLLGMEIDRGSCATLTLQEVSSRDRRSLAVRCGGNMLAISTGVFIPTILSSAYLNPSVDVLVRLLGEPGLATLTSKRAEYCRIPTWTLVFTTAYGDPIALTSSKELEDIRWV